MRASLFSGSAIGGILACLFPGVAHAQAPAPDAVQQAEPAAPETDAIIVTANRREENIQKVAASISVIGGDELDRQGITNSNEIAQAVPNVTITSTFNNSNPRIFIRGVGSADFNPNAASPIGIYVDDVYLASTNALQFQLFDVQRVEVLRGPQGTLYGRNTTGGAIKYFSNQPTDALEGEGRMRLGNMEYLAIDGALSGPIAGEALTGRIAFSAEWRDGNTVNRLTGKKTGNDIQSWGARGLFKLEPADDWLFTLNVHGGRASPHNVVYKPRGVLAADGSLCATDQALAGNCFDLLGYQDNDDPYSVANNVVGREIVETIGASLQAEKEFDWATLTSITAWDQVKLNRDEDSDGSPNQLLEIQYNNKSHQFSQELRLTSPGGEQVNWIVGAYYFNEKVELFNRYDILRSLRPVTGFDPSLFVVLADQNFVQHTDAYAAFGRVDIKLTDRLKLTGGLRYTYEKRRFAEDVQLTEPGFVVPVFTVEDKISNDEFSGDIILDYQMTDDVMLYASLARGFKSGGFNGAIVFDPAEVTSFDPETLTSFEVGFKSQTPDHRLTFNASGFYYDYNDLQVYTILNPPGGGVPIQLLDNAANASIYGMEADAAFALTPELKLNAAIGLLKSEFKDFVSDVADADFSGNRLARAPEVTANLGANLDLPVGDSYRIVADFDTSYRSKIFFDASNNPRLEQGGYWLANARLGFGVEDGGWEVAVWGKNIFDEVYNRDIIDLSLFGFDARTISDPATYGVELLINF